MMDPIELSAFVMDRIDCLRTHDIEVRTSKDFDELYALDLAGKKISPFFSPDHFDLSEKNAFWVEGRRGNKVVQVHAVRVQDSGDRPLATLWRSEFRRLFGRRDCEQIIALEGERMSGRATYHGDLWLSEELRGQKLGPVFAALGICLARIMFDPDYFYGFMEDPVVWSGFNQREGFMHAAPLGEGWRLAEGFLLPSDIQTI